MPDRIAGTRGSKRRRKKLRIEEIRLGNDQPVGLLLLLLQRALLRDSIDLLDIMIEAEPNSPAAWRPARLKAKVRILYEAKDPAGRRLEIKERNDAKGRLRISRKIFGDTSG